MTAMAMARSTAVVTVVVVATLPFAFSLHIVYKSFAFALSLGIFRCVSAVVFFGVSFTCFLILSCIFVRSRSILMVLGLRGFVDT